MAKLPPPSLDTYHYPSRHLFAFDTLLGSETPGFISFQTTIAELTQNDSQKDIKSEALKEHVVGVPRVWSQPHPMIDNVENHRNSHA
jgi:hypothetical protein